MERMKNAKVSRASVITTMILLVALVIIISVTVSSNRSKQDELPPDVTDAPSEESTPDSDTEETKKPETPEDNKKPTGGSAQVENKLPTFTLPTEGILTAKHDPELQVYSNTLNHYRVHLGIDIQTEDNAPVYAAADGKIAKIWKDDLMGYSIAVSHSGSSYTYYMNLSENIPAGITEGATVRAGQLIANVGNSAMNEIAEEAHLHFEMTVADLMVDPLAYFREDALTKLTKSE